MLHEVEDKGVRATDRIFFQIDQSSVDLIIVKSGSLNLSVNVSSETKCLFAKLFEVLLLMESASSTASTNSSVFSQRFTLFNVLCIVCLEGINQASLRNLLSSLAGHILPKKLSISIPSSESTILVQSSLTDSSVSAPMIDALPSKKFLMISVGLRLNPRLLIVSNSLNASLALRHLGGWYMTG